ncbi:MAG: ferrous-iron efflux pump FieF [Rhodobacteraceae bacterium HLUCCA12]|nr:MAG: ferrous-iron efflux pump FieF [Rhodobacteraceae bacterium HLUCCA12]
MNQPHHARLNLSAGVASVCVAITLIAVKLWGLAMTGALSLAATLVDNALDLLVSAGALLAIIYAARPPDDDHHFGHTSAEDLAALFQALVVLISAVAIAVLALVRLGAQTHEPLRAEGAGVAAMIVSVILTGALVIWQRYVARRTGNRVVAADSLHYLSDLLPALGALAALAISAWWNVGEADSLIALAAAGWLAWNGGRIGLAAWHALMDRSAPADVLQRIAAITDEWPGLRGWHDLRTRTAGSRLFISLHVEIDGSLTLDEAHAIGDGLEHALRDAFPDAWVIIHTDPVAPVPNLGQA